MAKKLNPIDELRQLDKWRMGKSQFYRDVASTRLEEFIRDDSKRIEILARLTQAEDLIRDLLAVMNGSAPDHLPGGDEGYLRYEGEVLERAHAYIS